MLSTLGFIWRFYNYFTVAVDRRHRLIGKRRGKNIKTKTLSPHRWYPMCRVRALFSRIRIIQNRVKTPPHHRTLLHYYYTPTPSKRDGTSAAAIENSPSFTYNILNIYYICVLRGHRTLV